MAYQLLTGKHPYGKMSAPKALDMGLKPEPVAKLSKRQNQGLARALGFHREDRPPSVVEFLEEIRPQQRRTGLAIAASILLAILIGLLAYRPAVDYLRGQENDAIIAILQPGEAQDLSAGVAQIIALPDPAQRREILKDARTIDAIVGVFDASSEARIAQGRALISGLGEEWQRAILDDPRVRRAIIAMHETKLREAYDPDAGYFDYRSALSEARALESIYPSSAAVLTIKTRLEEGRSTRLEALGRRFDQMLAQDRLISDPEREDVGDVLEIVEKLDPESPLLADDRLRKRYVELTQAALSTEDFEQAIRLADAAPRFIAGDEVLAQLRSQAESELARRERAREAQEVVERLASRRGGPMTIVGFREIRPDILALARIDAAHPLIDEVTATLPQVLASAVDEGIATAQWRRAETNLQAFAPFVGLAQVIALRERLSSAERAAGVGRPSSEKRTAAIDARIERIGALLDKRLVSPILVFEAPFKELVVLSEPGAEAVQALAARTAEVMQVEARARIEAGDLDAALSFIDRGRRFDPQSPALAEVEHELEIARNAAREKEEARAQEAAARVRQTQLAEHAQAGRVEQAQALLEELRRLLPEDAAYLRQDGPMQIASAYLRLAEERYAAEDYPGAVALARRGNRRDPRGRSPVRSPRAIRGRARAARGAGRAPDVDESRSAPRHGAIARPP